MSYDIVYNSDVVLNDNADLATYCIFYDKVLLPHTTEATIGNVLEFTRSSGSNAAPTLLSVLEPSADRFIHGAVHLHADSVLGEQLIDWEKRNKSLFQEGVLSRLPAGEEIDWKKEDGMTLTPTLANLIRKPTRLIKNTPSVYGYLSLFHGDDDVFFFQKDVISHLLRTDIVQPQIFVSKSARPVREVLKACEAESVFRYLLPRIALAEPDQILEVRRKVRNTREGFSMHLQKLSEGIESKLKGGEDFDEIRSFAQSVIETKLIPDYREYVRQIRAEKSGFWGKVIDPASKILQIDAAPWTPKFYGDLMKSLGFTFLAATSEKKQRQTNASQAYQFMYRVEKSLRQLS
ncbi:hypothetical protein BTH42_05580 [Burkholderia sp. SRS-W-2-2016]|uniref:hypothetical protein n=1 Tax=Burkholderia sp. SRS-W-2-2016 TaxID=1926878 RepID=UPI00094B5194|nr:hypothetical protein [Burkholderia sp. SRS-W-2-2016]OLL32694.1 hypothetical protein BTH42_05580 [Burkholderia sp. SRS-W-2-2016]